MPQPFDQSFKLLTEDDPRAALALFAGIPLSANLVVEPLDRELNLPTLRVDNLYRCRDGPVEFLAHLEAVSRYKNAVLDHQFDYVQALTAKYKIPCLSFLLLLTAKGVPRKFPRTIRRAFGDYTAALRLRPVRLWRIPAARVLEMNNPKLLPWIPLLKASQADLREAFQRLEAAGQDSLTTHLFVLGGLRYGSKEAFFHRLNDMILSEEVLQESSTYRSIVDRGRQAGLAEGLAEGRADGLRAALSKILIRRFGPLPGHAAAKIDAAAPKALDRWLENVIDAPSLKAALK